MATLPSRRNGETRSIASGMRGIRVPVAQLALDDLSAHRLRQLVDEDHPLRLLEPGETIARSGNDLGLRCRHAIAQHDHRCDVLPPLGIRQTDHGSLGPRWVGVDHLLALAAVHILTAGDDHVLHPIDDVEKPFVVAASHVARVEPATLEGLGRTFLVAEVSLQNLLATYDDLPHYTGRTLDHVFVDDHHVGETHRRAT